MIDLSSTPQEVLIARGQYSTVRAVHEFEKKTLKALCEELQSIAPKILRQMQPRGDVFTDEERLVVKAKVIVNLIEACCISIESLAKQKVELRKKAWTGEDEEMGDISS